MTKKLTEKYNDACIKLFEFLKMLYENDVEFEKVLDHFSEGNYDGTSNTHVTINKYLNALKIFGVKIKKIDRKYKLINSFYELDLNQNDFKSIVLLENYLELLPNGKKRNNLSQFLKNLQIRYNDTIQNLRAVNNNTQNLYLSFCHSEIVEQIKLCEKYCQDKQKLEIIYINNTNEEINLICSPIELVYEKRKICLRTVGNNGSRIHEIPIEQIRSIKQLPTTTSNMAIPTTVVYKIKNRLAKNYKLRNWERLDNIETNGNKIIINKDEDLNLLLRRLMRYGKECEIISPKFLRYEMIELINKTLENYQ